MDTKTKLNYKVEFQSNNIFVCQTNYICMYLNNLFITLIQTIDPKFTFVKDQNLHSYFVKQFLHGAIN